MNYQSWEKEVPKQITSDYLWKLEVYRLGLFIADIGWHDISKLVKDNRTIKLSDQLYGSLGSISANVAEGFSRKSNKEKARFYEYALGSARESRDWYFKSRYILTDEVVNHRIELLTQIIKLLSRMVSQQRSYTIAEDPPLYNVETNRTTTLLEEIPF
ncbi:MAG: four helix bundle protein [Chloroflexota bacterium]